MQIDMASISLGMLEEKADTLDPTTTMNKDNLEGHVVDIFLNMGKVEDNKTALASIASNAMDNATLAG